MDKREQTIIAAYTAACEADDAFQAELVRVYGKRKAADARYYPTHDDAPLMFAKEVKLATDEAWRRVQATIKARAESAQRGA